MKTVKNRGKPVRCPSLDAEIIVSKTPLKFKNFFLTYRVVQLSSTLARSANRDFEANADRSVPVWRMLSVLGSQGPISLGDVACVIDVDKGWMSRTLARLDKRGPVQRKADPGGARQFFLSLTKAGRDLHVHG